MHRLILAAALTAAAAGAGCLPNLTGAASPGAEAVREAVHGRVLETRARIRLYEAPLRLPSLWFLPAPAVAKQTALADRQRVLVTRITHTRTWTERTVWLQVTARTAGGWIRLGPDAEAEARLQTLFRDPRSEHAPTTDGPAERTGA